jgi:hypothetical protein
MPRYCPHPSRCPEAHAKRIPTGCSFLMDAIKNHPSLDEIKDFICSGYSLELDKKGRTIISYLLKYGVYEDYFDTIPKKISNEAFCDFITFLVNEKNQDVNTKDQNGLNALSHALIYNYDKCVIECLFNLGAKVDGSHIICALQYYDVSILDTLVIWGAKVDASHIKCALECRHDQSILDTLVNLGAKVDESHIMCALECGFSQSILDTLVKFGGKVNASHIMYALRYCNPCMLDILVKMGGKVDASHIKYAIELGDYLHLSVLPTLVKLGGKVDSDHIMYALEHRLPLYVLDNLVILGGKLHASHILYASKHCTPTVQDKLIKLRRKNVPRKGCFNI